MSRLRYWFCVITIVPVLVLAMIIIMSLALMGADLDVCEEKG